MRAGASTVPVVATLASRPAHAWSCKSPSAWGSLKANPNTSLRNSAGHRSYTDETWTLANWKNNTARSNLGKPWSKLLAKYPKIDNDKTRTTTINKKGKSESVFDHTKVTVDMLVTHLSIVRPTVVSGGTTVAELMKSATFGSYAVAAQINHILLASISDIDKCLTLPELKDMARLAYPPTGELWGSGKVKDYLHENWIVRPS